MQGCERLLLLLFFFLSDCFSSVTASVSYDNKAIIINGERRILISGSIHYPRSTPEMWPGLIQKAKDGGLDVIQTYVFWNGHEPSPGKYYFEGRYDLVKFIKLVKQAGLYVHLRIGPYVCAEWNFGGFPVWLKFVSGISFRTDNEPFKAAMQGFTQKIVDMMKAEGLFETQGGPIVLSQIENEFGPVEWEIGAPGVAYTKWATNLAVGLGTGVPWVMCKQDDAPDPIINTCNDYYCDWFSPNKPNKPKMWTENWSGWYTGFGIPVPHRPAEDVAFSVARFIQKGGSYMNYYMFHGGTNFGRTAGGPFIATSYDYDAPLDEYGLLREPKWGHLKDLHAAIKLCEPALVYSDPTMTKLGNQQEAHVFKYEAGGCAAFLANYDTKSNATVAFSNMHYNLPPWSISILPNCKNVVYNTARVGTQSSQMNMLPVWQGFQWNSYSEPIASYDGITIATVGTLSSQMNMLPVWQGVQWNSYSEAIASYDDKAITTVGLMEQISITRDVSDYLWYSTDVIIGSEELFLKTGKYPKLTVESAGHVLHVFINGQLAGTAHGSLANPKLTFSGNVKLVAGTNKISLLSVAVGLPNVGVHYETWNVGVLGPVMLNGLNEGKRELTSQKWSYKVGLDGEAHVGAFSPTCSSSVKSINGSLVAQNQPMTWYKATFGAIPGNDPIALDMNSMGKGQVWINGQSIGRYWPAYKASGSCGDCNYAGTYKWSDKCQSNCGEASQIWYHVPRSWLNPSQNLLTVFEEIGGDPNGVSLVKRTIESVCADVFEYQPNLKSYLQEASGGRPIRPEAHLSCAPGQKISSIKFASFGTPLGACGNFKEGSCHARKSYDPFEKNCIGQQACSVTVAPAVFGRDPCLGVEKKLSVEAICS